MSVTVNDLMSLPSLRQAKVLGGHRGLNKIVSSISVLESTDPKLLINGLFPQDEFFGSEIVITAFVNIVNDVECQCANIRRLAEGGEVGLILFYVGIYLPKVDQRLIDLANKLDFVLICMPEKQNNLRYSDVITDVTERIYRDRKQNETLVTDILSRVSGLPSHQQTVDTILKMLSDHLSASVVLCDGEFHILNLITWPRGQESTVLKELKLFKEYPKHKESVVCTFLQNCRLYRLTVTITPLKRMEFLLLKEGEKISSSLLEQVLEVVRLGVNIWGKQHGDVAMHELVRAILQDEPMKMRRLAEIFHVDVASIHEMWILCSSRKEQDDWLPLSMDDLRNILTDYIDVEIIDYYEGKLLLFLAEPKSLRDVESQTEAILSKLHQLNSSIILTRYGNLQETSEVRKAYLCHQSYLTDAMNLFPFRICFCSGETEFAQSCRELIDCGESAVNNLLGDLQKLLTNNEEWIPLETLCSYLLDCDSSVTSTARLLHIHKNTVKYRINRISDMLGYRPGKMPETIKLYQAAAVWRLLYDTK